MDVLPLSYIYSNDNPRATGLLKYFANPNALRSLKVDFNLENEALEHTSWYELPQLEELALTSRYGCADASYSRVKRHFAFTRNEYERLRTLTKLKSLSLHNVCSKEEHVATMTAHLGESLPRELSHLNITYDRYSVRTHMSDEEVTGLLATLPPNLASLTLPAQTSEMVRKVAFADLAFCFS